MLFDSFRLGTLTLGNRIVMAPMTRSRAGQPGNVPTELMAEYYSQRAGAGLLVSEGTQVSEQARGYLWTPGIHSPRQTDGWRLITDAVHGRGGRIFAQLWHCGRISHTSLQPGGGAPVSATEVAANTQCFAYDEKGNPATVPCSKPVSLSREGVANIVSDFRQATRNALTAGFDGVEIHGANGYLFEQFLNGGVNARTDDYGGTVARRARFLLEVVDAAASIAGANRVGVRLSPHSRFNDMGADPEADAMTSYLADELSRRGLCYLHLVDPAVNGYSGARELLHDVKSRFGGALIVCGDMTREKAESYLNEGLAELIAFGRPFISNPDLPERLRRGAPLTPPDHTTFYGGGEKGYTDYPTLA